MSKCRMAYAPECRQQLAELVHAARSAQRQRCCQVGTPEPSGRAAVACCCCPKAMSRKGPLNPAKRQELIELPRKLRQAHRASDQTHGMPRMMGVRPSMRTVGNAYDNAMAKIFLRLWSARLLPSAAGGTKPKHAWASLLGNRERVQPAPMPLGLAHLSPSDFERKPVEIKHQENIVNTETQTIPELQ